MGVGRGPDVIHPGVGELFPGGQGDDPVADLQGLLRFLHSRAGAPGNEAVHRRNRLPLLQNLPLGLLAVDVGDPSSAFQGSVLPRVQYLLNSLGQLGGPEGSGLPWDLPGEHLLPALHPVDPQLHAPLQNRIGRQGQHIVLRQLDAQPVQQLPDSLLLTDHGAALSVVGKCHRRGPADIDGVRLPGVYIRLCQLHPGGAEGLPGGGGVEGAGKGPAAVIDHIGGGKHTLHQHRPQEQRRQPRQKPPNPHTDHSSFSPQSMYLPAGSASGRFRQLMGIL